MKQHYLAQHLSIIQQRWPEIVEQLQAVNMDVVSLEQDTNTLILNNIQLTSNINRKKEAETQLRRIPEQAPNAYIYGPGLGDAIELLLERKSIKGITVVILNASVFMHSLMFKDHLIWLSDSRIKLTIAQEIKDVFSPFIVNPAELVLADQISVQLADRLGVELNQEFLSQQFLQHNAKRTQCLKKNLSFVENDDDINTIKKPNNNHVYIAAAGPTLDNHLVWLKQHDVYIIAVDAAVETLINAGIKPNIVISIDYLAFHFFQHLPVEKLTGIPLVYFPNIQSEMLPFWPGPRHCTYSLTPLYKDLVQKHPKTPLYSAGSVIHPAVDLAVFLQAKTIILLGADFAFVNNKSHAGRVEQSHTLAIETARHSLINYCGEKTPTMASFKGYLRDLERYIAKHPNVSFFTGSEQSAKIEGVKLWNNIL